MGSGNGMSPRRLLENEQAARHLNARYEDRVREIREQDEPQETSDVERPASFFCECSHDACRARLSLRLDRWNEIHADPSRFVVMEGHEVAEVERVVDREGDHLIVEKTAP